MIALKDRHDKIKSMFAENTRSPHHGEEIAHLPFDRAQIRLLCFDVDGTLRDTDDEMTHMLGGLLLKLRLTRSADKAFQLARRVVLGLEDPLTFLYSLLDRFGLDAPLVRLMGRLRRRAKIKRHTRHLLIQGTKEMLSQLQPHFQLAIVSVRDADSTQEFLERFDLLSFFSVVATAQTCEKMKPYPDALLWVMQSTGVSPRQCLMIGDTAVDIKAGKAAGCKTVGVLCGFGNKDELLRAGADVILPKTTDLLGLLI